MNAVSELLTTTITPEVLWQEHSSFAVARAAEDGELEKLKTRLLRRALSEVTDAGTQGFIRRAADDAAALAWDSRFPLLVFPTLFEEKAGEALAQMRRQLSVRRRSRQFMSTCQRQSCLVRLRRSETRVPSNVSVAFSEERFRRGHV